MTSTKISIPKCHRIVEIKVPVWWSNGLMMIRRDALDYDHPEQTYNWFTRNFPGVPPEDFGIIRPGLIEMLNDLREKHFCP